MKPPHIKAHYFTIVVLTIALLSLITIRTLDDTITHHQTLLRQLQKLEHHIHLLNEQVIKTQQGLQRNFDHISGNINHINHIMQQLQAHKELIKPENKKSIEYLSQLISISHSRTESVEQFLSSHIMVKNSLIALPILIEELQAHGFSNMPLAEQLLNNIYHYIPWQEPKIEKKITTILSRIRLEKNSLVISERLILIKAHSEIILFKTPYISQHLQHIFSSKLTKILWQVQASATQNFNHKLKQKQYLEWTICTLALTYLLCFFIYHFLKVDPVKH